jgi:hypothetical protein
MLWPELQMMATLIAWISVLGRYYKRVLDEIYVLFARSTYNERIMGGGGVPVRPHVSHPKQLNIFRLSMVLLIHSKNCRAGFILVHVGPVQPLL